MDGFVFRVPTRVLFGSGTVRQAGEECRKLGATKVFVVTGTGPTVKSAGFAALIESLVNAGLAYEVFAKVESDPAIETMDAGAQAAKACGADLVLAYGGGSPMDAGKAVAALVRNEGSVSDYMRTRRVFAQPGLPFIAIPTTAGSGSEVTAAFVTSDCATQEKIGVSSDLLFPKVAIIDPETHLTMPPATTAATGLDVLTHAIEAYTSKNNEPLSDALCLHAIRLVGENLRRAVGNGGDIEARSRMAVASAMAGMGFAQAGLGSVHGLAHAIGAAFHVPHGVANALMLPYVMEESIIADMPRFRDIAIALGENIADLSLREAALASVDAVAALNSDLGIPAFLSEVGVGEEHFPSIIEKGMRFRLRPRGPREFMEADFRRILLRALAP